MNLLSNLSLGKRLYLLAGAVTLALVALAATAHVQLSHVMDTARRTETARVPQLRQISDMELTVTRTSLQLRHGMLARDPAELAATLADIGRLRQLLNDQQQQYEQGLFTPAGKQRYAALPPVMAEFWRQGEANLALVQAGNREEAFAFLVDRTIPARNALLKVLADIRAYQEGALNHDIEGLVDNVQATLRLIEVLAVAIAAGLVLAAWRLAGSLRRRVALARRVAERVRDGDLATATTDDHRDELSPLLQALQGMRVALIEIVGHVRGNAESVASASEQIAQGNQDLSERTERQAAAVQQAATTMDHLGQTLQQTADNAGEASQLARNASLVAKRGGEVVGQVVNTMGAIREASGRIADITSLIDSIAFQTNILALNAAVEAARAGEHGRGFAVVASEVRTLAQRAADAAKDIKGLITTSVERVERGDALVGEAGATMKDIVSAVDRVNQIVADISAASRQQSTGVSSVAGTVGEMDQGLQQNAALVEEAAAAAATLNNQAARMVDAVAVFRV
ncbi:methyl-accepting chemotaxis protein [Roseateles sp. LKC17W]|uniref:Methyl-accepting chemotaxis protein n=1 Tax=Pelomonas margarita TaxID=3299031 RepID=A0ABW7FNH4_9BURK